MLANVSPSLFLDDQSTKTTILGKSPTSKLTVESYRGCSLKPCAADFRSWHSEIAASADNFRADQDQPQLYSVAFGFGVLNAAVLVAMRRVN